MKQRKNTIRILRAAALVLLTALGVTMLCGASSAGDTAAAADQPEAAAAASTETVLSYEEYFSQRREFNKGRGRYQLEIEKIAGGYVEYAFYYEGETKDTGRKISEMIVMGPHAETDDGILFANNGPDGAVLFMLNNDGLSLLCQLPEGYKVNGMEGDPNVLYLELAERIPAGAKRYLYRYYIPENRLEMVLDLNGGTIREIADTHDGIVGEWDAFDTENVLVTVVPKYYELRSVSQDPEAKQEYVAYLQQERNRRAEKPEVQEFLRDLIQVIQDGRTSHPYEIHVAYNLRTGEEKLLYSQVEEYEYMRQLYPNGGQ